MHESFILAIGTALSISTSFADCEMRLISTRLYGNFRAILQCY
jgi:hypothetical protein